MEKQRYSSVVDYHKIGFTTKETIIDFLFEIPFNENTKSFFENILDAGANFKNDDLRLKYDVTKYVKEIVEWFYYKVDSNNGNEKMLNNLWNYWDVLYFKIKNITNLYNQEYLFFGKWKYEADDWFVLKKHNISSIYLKKIESLSYLNVEALMQLLSGIGFQSLMPEGIKVPTAGSGERIPPEVALGFVDLHAGKEPPNFFESEP